MSAAPLPIGARVGSRIVLGYAQRCGYDVRATVRCDCGRVDEVSVRSMGRVCQSCARSGNGTRSAQPGRQARVIARSGRPDVVSALAEAGARAPDLWRADTAESVRAVAELADTGPYDLTEIGMLLGLSGERVRQIEAQALRKLRLAAAHLRGEYLEHLVTTWDRIEMESSE